MIKRNKMLSLTVFSAATSSLVILANFAGTGTAAASPNVIIIPGKPAPSSTASITPGPTVSDDPSTSPTVPPVTGAASVGGRFTLGNGNALPNFPVTISATDALPSDDGASASADVIGTATTDVSGNWNFTLPDPLPADLQSLADANGGVLNLEAEVDGTAPDGTAMTGSNFVAAGVAEGAATTVLSASARTAAPNTVAIVPVAASSADVQPPTDIQAANSYASQVEASNDAAQVEATPPQYQSNIGDSTANYNPEVVNGVNYAAVTPNRPAGGCGTVTYVLKSAIAYTVVGEAHAFWDGKATFDYSNKLSTTWTVGYSTDGKVFKISGTRSLGGSTGHEISVTGGPYWAHQIKIPIKYVEAESMYKCGGATSQRVYKIYPIGYDIPAGGYTSKVGADVSSKDGGNAYYYSNHNYRGVVDQGSSFALLGGRTSSYGAGVNVLGVSLSVTSQYDTNHYEKLQAGTLKGEHDIWGAHGRLSDDPGVFYAY